MVEKPFQDTDDWVWTNPAFLKWTRTPGTLWIKGKPGSGKSTIARMITDRMQEAFPAPETQSASTPRPVALGTFFYSSRMGTTAIRHELMLRSVLYQVLGQHSSLYKHFRPTFRSSLADDIPWDLPRLQHVFALMAKDCTPSAPRLCFVLDGFDESENTTSESTGVRMREFLKWLVDLSRQWSQRSGLRIIILSRPENGISGALRSIPSITVEDHNQQAIETLVDDFLRKIAASIHEWVSSDRGGSLQDKAKKTKIENDINDTLEYLRDQILTKAEGTLQWVVTVMKELQNQFEYEGSYNRKDLEGIMNGLPPGSGLYKLYSQIVVRLQERLDPRKHAKARRMLSWVCFARRPLDLKELRDALAIHGWEKCESPAAFQQHLNDNRCSLPDEENWTPFVREISDLSGCFLEVVRPRYSSEGSDAAPRKLHYTAEDTVQVTHQTVMEFLLRHDSGTIQVEKEICDAELTAYLQFATSAFKDTNCPPWTFEDSDAGSIHSADRSSEEADPQNIDIEKTGDEKIDDGNIYNEVTDPNGADIVDLSHNTSECPVCTPTTYLEAFPLLFYGVDHRKGHLSKEDIQSFENETQPIHRALEEEAIGETSQYSYKFLRRVFWEACECSLVQVARSLIRWCPSSIGRGLMEDACKAAIQQSNLPTLEMLLGEGIYDNRSNVLYFFDAVQDNSEDVVRMLLDHRSFLVEAWDNNFETALHVAARRGHERIATLLVQHGAKACAVSDDDITPLEIAEEYGHRPLVPLLVDQAIDLTGLGLANRALLLAAVREGQTELVRDQMFQTNFYGPDHGEGEYPYAALVQWHHDIARCFGGLERRRSWPNAPDVSAATRDRQDSAARRNHLRYNNSSKKIRFTSNRAFKMRYWQAGRPELNRSATASCPLCRNFYLRTHFSNKPPRSKTKLCVTCKAGTFLGGSQVNSTSSACLVPTDEEDAIFYREPLSLSELRWTTKFVPAIDTAGLDADEFWPMIERKSTIRLRKANFRRSLSEGDNRYRYEDLKRGLRPEIRGRGRIRRSDDQVPLPRAKSEEEALQEYESSDDASHHDPAGLGLEPEPLVPEEVVTISGSRGRTRARTRSKRKRRSRGRSRSRDKSRGRGIGSGSIRRSSMALHSSPSSREDEEAFVAPDQVSSRSTDRSLRRAPYHYLGGPGAHYSPSSSGGHKTFFEQPVYSPSYYPPRTDTLHSQRGMLEMWVDELAREEDAFFSVKLRYKQRRLRTWSGSDLTFPRVWKSVVNPSTLLHWFQPPLRPASNALTRFRSPQPQKLPIHPTLLRQDSVD